MPVRNGEIAEDLFRLAELLEIEGANPFRVRAYRNAARIVSDLPESVASMLAAGRDLAELPGVGHDLAAKIKEIAESGHLRALDEVEHRLPPSLVEMATIPGLGPKRIKLLHQRLKVDDIDALRRALKAGKLTELPGFGAKLQEKIRVGLSERMSAPKRMLLAAAEEIATDLLEYLKTTPGVGYAVVAGSFRRRKETVGDLDILITSAAGLGVMKRFVSYSEVSTVVAQGPTRATVMLRSGLQIDLRVVPQESYGAALHYFTGSKEHNIAIRARAVAKGLKINEYGVFKGKRRIAGRTETEVYRSVGLPYIEPELRESRGEIEAALGGRLPHLVALKDMLGDLHVHTVASDGHESIATMAEAAKERGYRYLAISDHSKRVTIAHGLDERRLARQIAEIDRLNARIKGIRILKSAEVDILADGKLDLSNAILAELDLTICAVHSKFDLPSAIQTERIIRAMDNPHFNILAHATGRLIGERAAYALDMERLLAAAKERGCFFEINAQPERLDLNDIHARMAKEKGVKLAISTDAHSISNLDFMRFGIDQARRAWLEPRDVLNTRPWEELRRLLKRA